VERCATCTTPTGISGCRFSCRLRDSSPFVASGRSEVLAHSSSSATWARHDGRYTFCRIMAAGLTAAVGKHLPVWENHDTNTGLQTRRSWRGELLCKDHQHQRETHAGCMHSSQVANAHLLPVLSDVWDLEVCVKHVNQHIGDVLLQLLLGLFISQPSPVRSTAPPIPDRPAAQPRFLSSTSPHVIPSREAHRLRQALALFVPTLRTVS
jgi:hypothetical protein